LLAGQTGPRPSLMGGGPLLDGLWAGCNESLRTPILGRGARNLRVVGNCRCGHQSQLAFPPRLHHAFDHPVFGLCGVMHPSNRSAEQGRTRYAWRGRLEGAGNASFSTRLTIKDWGVLTRLEISDFVLRRWRSERFALLHDKDAEPLHALPASCVRQQMPALGTQPRTGDQ
jgi:hypothetical protein